LQKLQGRYRVPAESGKLTMPAVHADRILTARRADIGQVANSINDLLAVGSVMLNMEVSVQRSA